jgi:hypothetical protein
MVAKKRHCFGSKHGRAKLSDEDVALIREEYIKGGGSQQTLASQYNVARSRISFLVTGKHWKHNGYCGRTFNDRKSHFAASGEHHHNASLTMAQAAQIRARYTGKWGEKTMLAKQLGVSLQTVCNVLMGKYYRKEGAR